MWTKALHILTELAYWWALLLSYQDSSHAVVYFPICHSCPFSWFSPSFSRYTFQKLYVYFCLPVSASLSLLHTVLHSELRTFYNQFLHFCKQCFPFPLLISEFPFLSIHSLLWVYPDMWNIRFNQLVICLNLHSTVSITAYAVHRIIFFVQFLCYNLK